MAKKKWHIDKYTTVDEYGKSDQAYLLAFGCVEYPGESIDDLSLSELIRLEKFIHTYILKEQKGKNNERGR